MVEIESAVAFAARLRDECTSAIANIVTVHMEYEWLAEKAVPLIEADRAAVARAAKLELLKELVDRSTAWEQCSEKSVVIMELCDMAKRLTVPDSVPQTAQPATLTR